MSNWTRGQHSVLDAVASAMCSHLFIVFSFLAVLGGAAAQTCSADSAGDFSGTSKAFPSTSINIAGSYIVPLPNLCKSNARGVQVWACARGGAAPAVTVLDHQHVQVSCPLGGCVVSAVGWCPYSNGEQLMRGRIQSAVRRPYYPPHSHHPALRSELVLPVQPLLGGTLGSVLFRGR